MEQNEIIRKANAQAKKFRADFTSLASSIKEATQVGHLIPTVIASDDVDAVRKAQESVAKIESILDRIIAIHHDAKIALQGISKVESIVVSALVDAGELAKNASGPTQQRILTTYVRNLMVVKNEWAVIIDLCQQAQSRLGSALKSLKFQIDLESNLRWAQHRPPN